MKVLSSPLWSPQLVPRSRDIQQQINNKRKKKGRPSGRPHIALDCCAPCVYPYTVGTSLQLALPAPCKCVSTSLSASLLKINICHHPAAVKQIMIIFPMKEIIFIITLYINELHNFVIFNILKKYEINVLFSVIPQQNTRVTADV